MNLRWEEHVREILPLASAFIKRPSDANRPPRTNQYRKKRTADQLEAERVAQIPRTIRASVKAQKVLHIVSIRRVTRCI